MKMTINKTHTAYDPVWLQIHREEATTVGQITYFQFCGYCSRCVKTMPSIHSHVPLVVLHWLFGCSGAGGGTNLPVHLKHQRCRLGCA